MVGFPEVVLGIAVVVLPVGCLVNWWFALQHLRSGEPLLRAEARENVSLGLVDLGLIVVVVALIAGFGVAAVTSMMGINDASAFESMLPSDQARVFCAFGVATLLSTLICYAWLWLRYHRLDGFAADHFGGDVELGIRWFTMLVVPVVLLQVLLTRWFPTRHPLIEMLRQSQDLSFLPIAAFAAVIAAPIFEESFFRWFMQGWLEKLQITMRRTSLGLSSNADRDAVLLGGASSAALGDQMDVDATPANANLAGEQSRRMNRPVLWIPIMVSSGLFALAHFSHGPDWIPLFFLSIGLGYLYQRTGRIQACIVVHMLVNALGIMQLWSAVRQP